MATSTSVGDETPQHGAQDSNVSDALDDFILPHKKCKDIRDCVDLYVYLKQNPRTFVAASIFLATLFCVLALLILYALEAIQRESCFIVAGIFGLVGNIYALCHFRTLLGLKEQIDDYSTNNQKFRGENALLSNEVARFRMARKELKSTRVRIRAAIEKQEENLAKFRVLNDNLQSTGKETMGMMGDLNNMADRMERKWKDELVKKERKILNMCFDRFDWEQGNNGMTNTQFLAFKHTLPMRYQERLTRLGNWPDIAGDDGIMQIDEFRKLLDDFTEDHVKEEFVLRVQSRTQSEDQPQTRSPSSPDSRQYVE